jgi:hypothetical protein
MIPLLALNLIPQTLSIPRELWQQTIVSSRQETPQSIVKICDCTHRKDY